MHLCIAVIKTQHAVTGLPKNPFKDSGVAALKIYQSRLYAIDIMVAKAN